MTCPTCGGVVEDHVCTNCGAAVWPDGTDGPGTTPPPPPSASTGGSRAGGPMFVNPPETTPPPPPPPPSSSPPVAPAASGWQPSPAPTGAGAPKKSNALWWILGGVGVLAVLGVVAVFALFRSVDLDSLGSVGDGSPERLAVLWDNCDQGDMQACDDLYLESPFDSPEESFGDTCGNRNDPSGWCVDIHGDTAPPN